MLRLTGIRLGSDEVKALGKRLGTNLERIEHVSKRLLTFTSRAELLAESECRCRRQQPRRSTTGREPKVRVESEVRNALLTSLIVSGLAVICGSPTVSAQELKAGAGAEVLTADDTMVIGGGIGPGKAHGQEGELRASAVVIEDAHKTKVALVACDVLMVERDVLDRAARRIEQATGIPFDHILINATHTHHAPTTATIHGYSREEGFTRQLEDKIVEAAVKAARRLVPATASFRLGEESSVGKNSRILLADGTIYWTGSAEDAVRPTGPFDPDLPVLAFKRADGNLEAVLFNHSTHTIGTLSSGVRSPSFYGLAAQALEKERGGTVLFFEGASGSTHNIGVPAAEATRRIREAVDRALDLARPLAVDRVRGVRKEVALKIRRFDEAADEKAVTAYCSKRIKDPAAAQKTIGIFRDMRRQIAPKQGQERKTWVQAIVIGDVAFVGVPGEFFTVLGQEIKRRSPFRYTYVFELANDYVGYIPDENGFDRGGYQVWTGLHSFLERGSGEAIVAAAVALLDGLHQ
jgi:neutral ceramidase